jgi:uncharacterized membrane protein
MPSQEPKNQPAGLTAFFFRGLVTLLPVVLTLVVFGLLFQMVDRYVTGPINSTIYWSLERNALGWQALEQLGLDPLDEKYLSPELLPLDVRSIAEKSPEGFKDPRFQEAVSLYRHGHLGLFRDLEDLAIRAERLRGDVRGRVHPLIGVVLSVLLVLWLGWIVGGFVGRRLMQHVDRTMTLIPVVKSVYPYSKQLVEFFFAKKKIEFDTVVGVPFPAPGSWAIAFCTKGSLKTLERAAGKELVCVFVPSSPMPMTGYTMFVEREKVVSLPLTIDEAIRVVMTGGVLIPPSERIESRIVGPEAPAFVDPAARKERA